MDELNQDEPEAGEIVLCCEHAEDWHEKPFHLYDNPMGDPDEKPQVITLTNMDDGTEVKIRWVILCDDCAEERTDPEGEINPLAGPLRKAMWVEGNLNTKVQ